MLEHRISANIKLFHDAVKARIPEVKIPGFESGSIILMNAMKFEDPSIFAASSRSIGTDSKYGIIIQIIVGSDTIKWHTISERSVPTSFNLVNKRYHGTRNEIAGTIRIIRIMPEKT